jgi:hypothetical protein
LVSQRTALINHTRGLLAEYGVVLPKGASRSRADDSWYADWLARVVPETVDRVSSGSVRLGRSRL